MAEMELVVIEKNERQIIPTLKLDQLNGFLLSPNEINS